MEGRICTSLTEEDIEVCHSLGLEPPNAAVAVGAAQAISFLAARGVQVLRQLQNAAVLGQALHKGLPQPFQIRVWLLNGVPICQHFMKPYPVTCVNLWALWRQQYGENIWAASALGNNRKMLP